MCPKFMIMSLPHLGKLRNNPSIKNFSAIYFIPWTDHDDWGCGPRKASYSMMTNQSAWTSNPSMVMRLLSTSSVTSWDAVQSNVKLNLG